MVFLFFLIVVFFIIMFIVQDKEHEHKTELLSENTNTSQSFSSTDSSNYQSSSSSRAIYVSIQEYDKALNAVWRLKGLDKLDDRLDSYQQNFAFHGRQLMQNSLQRLGCKVVERVNILDKTNLLNLAIKELYDILDSTDFLYIRPYYLSIVDEIVKECQREKLRKEYENGDENLKDLVRMITKDESSSKEIELIAKASFSEKNFDLYQRTIRNIYHKIPYSYYGIYKAILIRDKGKDNRTLDEEAYLQEYIEYFDRAAKEVETEYYQEYS